MNLLGLAAPPQGPVALPVTPSSSLPCPSRPPTSSRGLQSPQAPPRPLGLLVEVALQGVQIAAGDRLRRVLEVVRVLGLTLVGADQEGWGDERIGAREGDEAGTPEADPRRAVHLRRRGCNRGPGACSLKNTVLPTHDSGTCRST